MPKNNRNFETETEEMARNNDLIIQTPLDRPGQHGPSGAFNFGPTRSAVAAQQIHQTNSRSHSKNPSRNASRQGSKENILDDSLAVNPPNTFKGSGQIQVETNTIPSRGRKFRLTEKK